MGSSNQEAVRAMQATAGDQVAYVMHEGIVTHDAERCKHFYVTALGLEVLPRPAFTSKGYWLGAPGRFPQIHIIQADFPVPGPDALINAQARHTCFGVVDYDGLKARLEREGIKFREQQVPAGAPGGGGMQLLCNDPDGHTLEFQQIAL